LVGASYLSVVLEKHNRVRIASTRRIARTSSLWRLYDSWVLSSLAPRSRSRADPTARRDGVHASGCHAPPTARVPRNCPAVVQHNGGSQRMLRPGWPAGCAACRLRRRCRGGGCASPRIAPSRFALCPTRPASVPRPQSLNSPQRLRALPARPWYPARSRSCARVGGCPLAASVHAPRACEVLRLPAELQPLRASLFAVQAHASTKKIKRRRGRRSRRTRCAIAGGYGISRI